MGDEIADATADRSRLFWRLQFAGWGTATLLAVIFAGAGYFGAWNALVIGLARTAFGFGATCGLRVVYRRLPAASGNIWLTGVVVFLLCGVLGVADGLLAGVVANALGIGGEQTGVWQFLVTSVFMRWMIYWLWSLLYFGINFWLDTQDTRLRLARAEAEARVGELRLLRAQVNPHFLFNALNSILAESDNPAAVQSLTQALAEYLRFSLRQPGDSQPLGAELEALENYLRVEKARFEEKLEFHIDASAAARQAPVPAALVQPLVENAIKYGQRTSPRPLRIGVTATVSDSELRVEVINSGAWVEPDDRTSTGSGLANLRRRLHLISGPRAELSHECAGNEVLVRVRLPLNEVNGSA